MKNLILGLFLFSGFSLAQDDNQITIEQAGDNFDLEVEQIGYGNVIKRWRTTEGIDGADNTVKIKQYKSGGSSSDQNVIEIRRIWGDGNSLFLGQGFSVDGEGNMAIETGGEWGDTFAHINVTGDNNEITMQQTTSMSSTGHEYWLHLEGDDNDIHTKQQGGGGHYINLDIYSDSNEVELIQKNQGDKSTHIILGGTDPTNILLKQQGLNASTYNLTQYCYTPGGCTVSVTQE